MRAILSLGTNIGDRKKNLIVALKLLKSQLKILDISSVYESVSLLRDNQNNYLNIAIYTETQLNPIKLLNFIKCIENEMGRVKTKKWQERIIDIDIIDCENKIINSGKLVLPHSEMHKRSFVLLPLIDIVENYVHPIYNLNITEMLSSIDDNLDIVKLPISLGGEICR